MKKIFFTTAVAIICFTAYAQNDSLYNQTNNSSIPKSDAIGKARRLLLDKFIEMDFYGVMNEMNYLMSMDDENYMALFPQEFWLLSFWLKDYTTILKTMVPADTVITTSKIKRIPPQPDYLTTKIIEKTTEHEKDLTADIYKASLSDDEKDFLSLYLKFLCENISYHHSRQQELNVLADKFLTTHPTGQYSDFVRKYIRVKYEPVASGTGYSFHAGALLLSGNMQKYFNSPTFIGLGIDALKNKWLFQFNIGFAFGKTKMGMPLSNATWPAGSKVFGGHIDVVAGYFVLDNTNIGLAPYISAGVFGLPSSADMNKQPELKQAGVKTNIAGTLGFITDFKLSSKSRANHYTYFNNTTQTTSLRLTYGYMVTPNRNKYVNLDGSIHKVTLGVAILGRKNKRVI